VPSWVYKEIFVYECYAPPRALKEKPLILDIGANIGLAALYFMHRFPTCRLVAFEPNPRAFPLLRATVDSIAHAGSVELHPVAVSTHAGRVGLQVERGIEAPLNASITGRDTQHREVEIVDVEGVDLRTFITEPVDFMKLDVEGAELELLPLPEISPERVRSLGVEIHDIHERTAEVRRAVECLLGRGYEMSGASNVEELCARHGSHVVSFAGPS
jgi:FkbM family methyltransferase